MNPFSTIVGAISTVFGGVKDIIQGHIQNDADKIAASVKLGELQVQLQTTLIQAGEQFVDAQKSIIVAEAQSQSWLPRNIRPLGLLVFLAIIVYQGVFVSVFHLPPVNFTTVPDKLWNLIMVGFGGYILSRGAEKVAANWNGNGNSGE